MTKAKEFKLLEDYKKESHESAVKLAQFDADATAAKSRLYELQTQYELTFTKSISGDKAATQQLSKIDDDIALQKEVVARRERDRTLAYRSMPPQKISPVDVTTKFRTEFAPSVRKEFVDKVTPKLELARSLIISALIDGKEYAVDYYEVTDEIKEISSANHKQGLTKYIEMVSHPTSDATILGARGTTSAVRKLIEDISKYTHDNGSIDYEYIEVAPTIKTNTTEKEGK